MAAKYANSCLFVLSTLTYNCEQSYLLLGLHPLYEDITIVLVMSILIATPGMLRCCTCWFVCLSVCQSLLLPNKK